MTLFIDNNLGQNLAAGMKAFGEDVSHLRELFPANAKDTEWLPVVGARQYILVTRDEEIRREPSELAALKKNAVGAFFLGGKGLNRCQLIQQLVRNWPRIKELAHKERRPFAFRIPPSGTKFTKISL